MNTKTLPPSVPLNVALSFPPLLRVRQRFPRPRLDDVEAAVQAELAGSPIPIPAGGKIAIAVGSRGIANLALIVRSVVSWVKAQGGHPFIVPAMGSHGGATAEGQRQVVEGYGVTQAFTGAPIHSSMEVVELPNPGLPIPLYFDAQAYAADGVILINRIKLHTDFHGKYESGLMKMIVIGLGKHAQAMAVHHYGTQGLRELMPQAAQAVISQGRVLMGLAVVENAYDETQLVRLVPAAQIPQVEPELLTLARNSMPRLPVDELDVLVIDRFGKDISGAGIDTNIIGRWMIHNEPEPERPHIKSIVLGDLSPGSHGNAIGMGLADVMVRRAYDKIDWSATYENMYTSSFLYRGRTPVVVDTDQEALRYALRGSNVIDPKQARMARIQDTLHLADLLVSPAVLSEIESRDDIQVLEPAGELFDPAGSYLSETILAAA
jgi:hypothetical protein